MPDTNLLKFVPGNRIRFVYTNWQGEQAIRQCILESIAVGVTEYHPDKIQWFINGLDLDKNARRTYALADIEPSSMESF